MSRKRIAAALLAAVMVLSSVSIRGAALSGVGVEDSTQAVEQTETEPVSTAETADPSETGVSEAPLPETSEETETETEPPTTAAPTAPSLSQDDVIRIMSGEDSRRSEEAALLEASLLLARRLARLAELNNNTLAVCRTSSYVNVRAEASRRSAQVGKIHNNAVATVVGKAYGSDGTWYHIQSGTVDGYVKSEYFVTGAEALALYDQIVTRFVVVNDNVESLRLRTAPSLDANIMTVLNAGQRYPYGGQEGGWTLVNIGDTVTGYVSSDYVHIELDVNHAISLEEERALMEEAERIQREYEERLIQASIAAERRSREESSRLESLIQASLEAEAASLASSIAAAQQDKYDRLTIYGWTSEDDYTWSAPAGLSAIRTAICLKATSYLGRLDYVWGGNSLDYGVDCSGFLQQIFRLYGIQLPRVSHQQGRTGTLVSSFEEARPGDIIYYTGSINNGVGHVGIFLGFTEEYHIPLMIHAPQEGEKIKISRADYRPDLGGIRNVIGD